MKARLSECGGGELWRERILYGASFSRATPEAILKEKLEKNVSAVSPLCCNIVKLIYACQLCFT